MSTSTSARSSTCADAVSNAASAMPTARAAVSIAPRLCAVMTSDDSSAPTEASCRFVRSIRETRAASPSTSSRASARSNVPRAASSWTRAASTDSVACAAAASAASHTCCAVPCASAVAESCSASMSMDTLRARISATSWARSSRFVWAATAAAWAASATTTALSCCCTRVVTAWDASSRGASRRFTSARSAMTEASSWVSSSCSRTC
ncbi:Uncharacterised protein [Mycobacteroides abscessus subsp. abscessus]|nr:Uncharacterised protein [Mycobacteroides abscessus subsp. abscessus]